MVRARLLVALLVTALAMSALWARAPLAMAGSSAASQPWRVLALFPTESADPISALLERGLRETLRADDGGLPTALHVEYLELARLPDASFQQAQLEWLRRKYADRPPDAVVAFGTSTARLLGTLEAPLFPSAVAVYAALDPLLFPDLAVPDGAEALWVRYDISHTLDAALNLQPSTRHVLLIAGTADFDRAMLAHARQELAPFAGRVEIEELTDLPLNELVRRVAEPPATVVLFLAVNRDGSGVPLAVGEGLQRVLDAAGAPVYTNTETSVGLGVVGGAVTRYGTLGAEAARALQRRLAEPGGAPAISSPVELTLVFDWRQLERWGLEADRLPPASEVRFRPPSLWEQYRWYVAGALVVIVAQGLLLAGLLLERAHRRRTQSSLAERQEDLVRANLALATRSREVEERNAEIRAMAGRLITAQEQERAQIARELHDEVGQTLTILKINLDNMRLRGDSEATTSLLNEDVALVEQVLNQVRDLSLLLRPAVLDYLGLEAALRWLVSSQAQRAGYRATLTTDTLDPPPSPDVAITCYRVAQEALTNIARHARAREVTVEVRRIDDELRMTVHDDGIGFRVAAMRLRARQGGSTGLLSLEQRARLCDGSVRIDSSLGRGTTLTLALPYTGADSPVAGQAFS